MNNMVPIITEDDNTHVVGFQVESHTSDAGSELDHFTGLDFVESNNSGNTITNADDSSELLDVVLGEDRKHTTWVMLMILSWITLAVSAMPSFLELNNDFTLNTLLMS